MIEALTGEDMAFPMAMVESMREGKFPFREINPEWDDVRGDLFSMMKRDVLKKNAPKVRKILARTHRELKSI